MDIYQPTGAQNAKLANLHVPLYPLKTSAPFLLFDGLTQHFGEPDEPQYAADRIPTIQKLIAEGIMLIAGVSGAGKTRTVCEYLAQKFGLLFVVETAKNGGIKVSQQLLYDVSLLQ